MVDGRNPNSIVPLVESFGDGGQGNAARQGKGREVGGVVEGSGERTWRRIGSR